MSQTIASPSVVLRVSLPSHNEMPKSVSLLPNFDSIKEHLSTKPLKRPGRMTVQRVVTNEELLILADASPVPKEWLDGEEECPFEAI
ncbi:hypothetical protein [Thalassoglobus polymorphus]|uniref:Uncharacterized protein n=1 Tax=Thalassoglobus polymorphus TaxID=2527994 RepID=A0A517QTW3_9PLAN|nr:hypothetical protein [Thalassoglobus polymorphus]QDT35084.1 hypothetical protein Mal48_43590 [Thalassoglobus polymorphus]